MIWISSYTPDPIRLMNGLPIVQVWSGSFGKTTTPYPGCSNYLTWARPEQILERRSSVTAAAAAGFVQISSSLRTPRILKLSSCSCITISVFPEQVSDVSALVIPFSSYRAFFIAICQMSCAKPIKSSMPISTPSQITVDCKSVHWTTVI